MPETRKLIKDIERKDRRFRLTQSVFMILLMLVLVGVIFLQYRTLQGVQTQLQQQKQTAAESAKLSAQQRETIIRRLDCITAFFTRKDRTNLTITDIDKCSVDSSSPQQFFNNPPATDGSSSAPQSSGTQSSASRPASSPSQPAPAPSQGPVASPPPQQPSLLDRILAPIKKVL